MISMSRKRKHQLHAAANSRFTLCSSVSPVFKPRKILSHGPHSRAERCIRTF